MEPGVVLILVDSEAQGEVLLGASGRAAIGVQVAGQWRPRSLVSRRLERPHGDGFRLFPGDLKQF